MRNIQKTLLPATRATCVLNGLVKLRGAYLSIGADNGPEFIARALAELTISKGIALNHSQPAKSTQNVYEEPFNQTYRAKALDCDEFDSLQEVRD